MPDPDFFHSGIFNWFVLPILIFLARMADVTLGTIRHIFLSKGFHKIVPVLGFIEALIWIIVIRQIMKNLNNITCYIAWAGGFSMGTYIGMKIESKLALGLQVMRIITNQKCDDLIAQLSRANLGVTVLDGLGSQGPVKVILTIIKRKDIPRVDAIVKEFNPNAFYSLEDIREASKGVFPGSGNSSYLRDWFLKRK